MGRFNITILPKKVMKQNKEREPWYNHNECHKKSNLTTTELKHINMQNVPRSNFISNIVDIDKKQ